MIIIWQYAACLIRYSFLNPYEIITPEKSAQQISEKHQKLQCLKPALVNRLGPILHDKVQLDFSQPVLQKLTKLGR